MIKKAQFRAQLWGLTCNCAILGSVPAETLVLRHPSLFNQLLYVAITVVKMPKYKILRPCKILVIKIPFLCVRVSLYQKHTQNTPSPDQQEQQHCLCWNMLRKSDIIQQLKEKTYSRLLKAEFVKPFRDSSVISDHLLFIQIGAFNSLASLQLDSFYFLFCCSLH